MGLNLENVMRFNHIHRTVVSLAESMRENLGEDAAKTNSVKGDEDNPHALVFLDVADYMTLGEDYKDMFETAVHEADGVNFFTLPGGYIRFTFSVKDYWNREKDPYETELVELPKRTK